jgi:hypothetical protein
VQAASKGADLSLYVRAYWPGVAVTNGKWTPPPMVKSQGSVASKAE